MLVLTRRKGEQIRITIGGKTRLLTFLETKSKDSIRLGFEAPDEFVIWREEIAKENDKDGI